MISNKNLEYILEKGLIQKEGVPFQRLEKIEKKYNFSFPEELLEFLKNYSFIGKNAIDWYDDQKLDEKIKHPIEGILFDLKYNDFWIDSWGSYNLSYLEKKQLIEEKYKHAPFLIPLYGHRYLPCFHGEKYPVISVQQTDIIYYGSDFNDWFFIEFLDSGHPSTISEKKIPFRSEIIEYMS